MAIVAGLSTTTQVQAAELARPSASNFIGKPRATSWSPLSSFHYFGGHVISRAQVVVVLWGGNVSSTASSNMGSFYTAVLQSPYMDWLGEYDTAGKTAYDGKAGTSQHVYRGKLLSTVTITPSHTSKQIQDSDITSELASQINGKVLPAPVVDAEGGVDTLYMIYFPPGVAIYDSQGAGSCNTNSQQAFCGYHGAFQANVSNQTVSVPYGVIPDMTSPSCAQGCGGNTVLEDYTITSSHELIEAITDTEIGVGQGIGRPVAFYDYNQGEVGDICANQNGSTTQMAGFTVQREWSQRLGACIAQDANLPICANGQRPCRPCSAGDNGGACNGATPVCETSTASPKFGQCVACTGSSSCSGGKPVCDTSADSCRGCQSDGECGASKCDLSTGTCVACNVNNDCTNASQAFCDTGKHSCRGCQASDCASPQTCDAVSGKCVGCQSNSDCTNPNLAKCDTASHACVADPKASGDGGASADSDGGAGDSDAGLTPDDPSLWNKSGCTSSPTAPSGGWGWLAGIGLAVAAAALRRRTA